MNTATRKLTQAGTRTARQATPKRSSWFASIRDEAISFFKGDNNAPWAILAETVIGLVPVLGQIVDARDIIKALIEVSAAPASPAAWFNLITALIGLIPGGGDVVKRSLRVVKARVVPIDKLLDFIRQYYKGDPEKLLREMLDLGKLRKVLDTILSNPKLLNRLDEPSRKQLQNIQNNLGKQFNAFKREVDEWLAQTPRTSAGAAHASKKNIDQKPKTQSKAGSKNKGKDNDRGQVDKPNPATTRADRFKRIKNHFMGVLGEHMADYHCQEVKGWGSKKALHDQAQTNPAKLNDGGRLVQLWPALPRGRGIDAVWHKGGGAKPYAIIEAKASYNPAKTLNQLLGEAGDKSGLDSAQSGSSKRSKKGRSGGKGSAASQSQPRQANGKVTQMSLNWIDVRLSKAIGHSLAETIKKSGYSRHVLFFSIPHAVAHAEAVIKHIAKESVQHTMHSTHQVTREWGDNAISQTTNNRAKVPFKQRRAN